MSDGRIRWYAGSAAEDVAEGVPVPVDAAGRRFVVVRIGDDFYALGGRCTHTGEALSEVGEIDGTEIECTAHGARFDLASGEATCLPATRALPTAEVRVVDGRLELGMSEPVEGVA